MIKSRDHRVINQSMRLYHKQKIAPGMIFWHKNGYIIFNELKKFISEQLIKWHYEEVQTPILMSDSIWKMSGHIDNFKESIFYVHSESQRYCIKPMNCPAHIQIFNKYSKSYRDLPVRMAEFGLCHRNETSGSLYGLMRLNSFTQDDAHIFCSHDQIKNEVINCIDMILSCYKIFGFKKIHIKFSTRPKNRIGDDITWDRAELSLKQALLYHNIQFKNQDGEGAFYGPKIEFILEDNINRLWQCGTIQLDFYLSKIFNAYYIDSDNQRKNPIIIHRAILGSIERFIGILLEEFSGNLPIWLSPIQVVIINVNNTHEGYVKYINKQLLLNNIRVKYDIKNETITYKIKKYTNLYVPYIIICGDKEINLKKVSIRGRKNQLMQLIDLSDFIKKITYEITNRISYYMGG